MPERARAAVEIRRLAVDRGGTRVLDSIDLSIAPGTVTGLLGPSGCGKTTLLRSIVGVQIMRSGEVRVLGRLAGDAALRPRVGYVTQAPSVYRDLSVFENLAYFGAILRVGEPRIDEVLRQVDLQGLSRRVVSSLSGGQQARVSLATALLGEPDVLILDEPTVGLDPVLRRDLWELFRDLARSGATLVISSHVMDEATECDELILMREGSILATDTPENLRRKTGMQDLGRAFLQLIEGAER